MSDPAPPKKTRAEKDEETKRRVSSPAMMKTGGVPVSAASEVRPAPPPSLLVLPKGSKGSLAEKAASTSTTNIPQPKILQSEWDEQAKRRVSAAMKNSPAKSAAENHNANSNSGATQLIRPGRRRTFASETGTPTTSRSQPKMSQIERDEETKRRVSAAMKPAGSVVELRRPESPSQLVLPPSPITPKSTTSTDKKLSPKPTSSGIQYSPIPPSPTSLVFPRPSPSPGNQGRITPPLAMPKAKMNTPNRLSPQIIARSGSADDTDRRRATLPFMPMASDIDPNHRVLGDKKQRVSLPPSVMRSGSFSAPSSPAHDQSNSNAMSNTNSNHRHLGERKGRLSLPPSAARASISLPATPTRPGDDDHHRHHLGDRKFRSSLPPAHSPGVVAASTHRKLGHNRRERLSLPPQSTTPVPASPVSHPPVQTPTPPRHRILGDKKNRISTPVQQQQQQQQQEGEWDIAAACSWTPVSTPNEKRQGRTSTPDIAGPGAFFVSRGEIAQEENDDNNNAEEQRPNDIPSEKENEIVIPHEEEAEWDKNSKEGDVEEGNHSATFTASSTNSSHRDHRVSARNRHTSSRGSTYRSSRQRETPKEEDEGEPMQEEKSGCLWRSLCCWCSILVPLLLAAIVVTIVVLMTGLIKEDAAEPKTKASTPTPVPTAPVFAGEAVPNFTLSAWNDPTSPQSKAREWLQLDPNVASYTPYRKFQRFALATLYYSTNGLRWQNATNWMSYEQHECKWYSAKQSVSGLTEGIVSRRLQTANSTSGTAELPVCNALEEYEYLYLAADSLRGPLPAELSLLTSLKSIDVEDNKIQGTIPTELGTLSKLTNLNFNLNEIAGTMPTEMGQLLFLKALLLRKNRLSGTLPTQLSYLFQLRDLHLTQNLFSSSIPSEIGKLSQLRSLRLGDNAFTRTIPLSITRLPVLQILNFGVNQLTGSLPSELGLLSNLQFLGWSNNKFNSTTLPTELGMLRNLQTMYGQYSSTRGTIPSEFGNLESLLVLSLTGNRLSSSIPSEIGKLSKLEALFLPDNRLSGALPSEIGLLTRLFYLHIYFNRIAGTIPTHIGNLSNLVELLAMQTQITGRIPSEMANLTNLKKLSIQGTSLTGTVPICSLVSTQGLALEADCDQITCCNA